jgi:hypothetical protein
VKMSTPIPGSITLFMISIFACTSICFSSHKLLHELPHMVGLVYSCCSHLEHRASMKRFVSLQFLNLRHSVGLLDEWSAHRKVAT